MKALPSESQRRRRKGSKRRVAGRILPQMLPTPTTERGECWICGTRTYGWSHWSIKWHNRWWCWRHHPLRPRFHDWRALHSEATSYRDRARHERKVDAGLGRKKLKGAKPRKRTRDRAYRR